MDAEKYMQMALELAEEAGRCDEVPVGCVIVDKKGKIIGRGRNRREAEKCATAHAEIEAIEQACQNVDSWRLEGCSLYVTLEPCPMCAGAIMNARISRVFYGAKDDNSGSCGSVINLFLENYGFEPEIRGGILENKCIDVLQSFFRRIR